MKFILKKVLPASAAMVIALSTLWAAMPAGTALASYACPTTSSRDYNLITVSQVDKESSKIVRPTYNHPNKTLWMRNSPDGTTVGSWTPITATKDFMSYSQIDNNAPHFATLFMPTRVPTFKNLYEVHKWDLDGPSNNLKSPDPGVVLSAFEKNYPQVYSGNNSLVTALGVATVPGETLRSPEVGYNVGSPVAWGAVVLYADSEKHSITLHFTAEDTVAKGYTVQIDNVCIDPELQTKYDERNAGDQDTSRTGRYLYKLPTAYSYKLPGLKEGQIFGTAMGYETILVMRDVGNWADPRDLDNWWGNRPAKGGPGLGAPESGATFSTASVPFEWSLVGNPSNPDTSYGSYELQIDDTTAFKAPVSIIQTDTSETVFLSYGTHYWRVRVNPKGSWSLTRSVNVTAGSTLTLPASDDLLTIHTPYFEWTAMAGSDTHKVEIATDKAFSNIVQSPTASTDTNYTASPDLPDGTYYWHVLSYDSTPTLIGISAAHIFTIDTTAPSAPNPKTPANGALLTASPTLTWTASTGSPTKYRVEYANNDLFTDSTLTGEISGTSYVTSGLAYEHVYWHVQARDAAENWSAFGPTFSFVLVPLAPGLLNPANNAPSATGIVPFEWSPATGAVSYEIQVDNSSDFNSREYESNQNDTGRSSTSLPLDTAYNWRVRAYNLTGEYGAWSVVRKFTVNRKPPAPTGLSPSGISSEKLPDFTWTGVLGESAATSYAITVKQGKTVLQNNVVFSNTDAGCDADTSCALTDPFPSFGDGAYTYTITPSNSYGTGLTASGSFTVDTIAPTVPVNSSPKDLSVVTKALVKVAVKSVKTATRYDFEVSTDPAFPALGLITGSNTKSYVNVTLPDYGVYYFRAKASDAASNESGWSYPFSFSYSMIKAPKNNAATTDTTPTFSWGSFSGASTWDVVYVRDADLLDGVTPDPTGETPIPGTAKGYTPPTPLEYGVYYWSMRINGGAWMPVQTFTISRMMKLTNNTVTTDTTPSFSWQTYTGAPSWRLAYGADPDPSANTPVSPDLLGTAKSYTVPSTSPLSDGEYYWSISDNSGTDWMPSWKFLVTHMQAPKNGSFTTDTTPTFKWLTVAGAANWDLAYTSDPDGNPTDGSNDTAVHFPVGTTKSYTPTTPLPGATKYYWSLRVNGGPWMPVFSFVIQ